MADLKNVATFTQQAELELSKVRDRAQRELERLIEDKRLELRELERAAEELGGLSFDSLFRSAAVVLVRECRILGDRYSGPARIANASVLVRSGLAYDTAPSPSGGDTFYLREGHSRDSDGPFVTDGYYRVITMLVPITPSDGEKAVGDAH